MSTNNNGKRSIRAAAGLAAGLICMIPTAVRAQEQPAPPAPQAAEQATPQQGAMIKKESKLVLVDAVVTDKKGNYISDLVQKDFKVWEDDKEQPITSFSAEAGQGSGNNDQKHYLVLFFDNSTMDMTDQARARDAAAKFIAANAGPNRLMAIADFTGAVHIAQGDVLYCCLEDNPRRLQRRVTKLLSPFTAEWPERLTLATRWQRLDRGGVEDVEA